MTDTATGIHTAESKIDIINWIVENYAAVFVDQKQPLNWCGMYDPCVTHHELPGDERDEFEVDGMEAPLLIDAFTASMLQAVYVNLKEDNQRDFLDLSWVAMADIGWKVINRARAT